MRIAMHDVCPICGAAEAASLCELGFSKKPLLPQAVSLGFCAQCDFAYISPADQQQYDRYYAETKNDLVHDALSAARAQQWIDIQSRFLKQALAGTSPLRILDYGCGSGDLIAALAKEFPAHHFTGFDVHPPAGAGAANLRFISDSAAVGEGYDVVILSHVLEHIVDLGRLEHIAAHLKEGGFMYIEVPDAASYPDYARREYLYYIDRLHVNHFSYTALVQLAQRHGLSLRHYGKLELPYKDGKPYPSHYLYVEKRPHRDLGQALGGYIASQSGHPALAAIDPHTPLLIYGFGDNFFRCRSTGGPLYGRPIAAVIDRRWEELNRSDYRHDYTFKSMAEALAAFPQAPVVIAVSWGAEHIADDIRAQSPSSPVVIL